jgi:hypothetical protein
LFSAQAMVGRDQLSFPLYRSVGERRSKRHGFDPDPVLRDVDQLADDGICDAETALSLRNDEPLRSQPAERFSNGPDAHAIVRAQLLDAQFAAGRISAGQDVGADVPQDRLYERFRRCVGRLVGGIHGGENIVGGWNCQFSIESSIFH